MATPANHVPRFQLPARIRIGKPASEELSSRLALADRIADLAGVEAVECGENTLPRQIAIYVHRTTAGRTILGPRAVLLCRLSADGIVVHGLDNWAKHQVVMRAWGRLLNERVSLFLPRDEDELETCWSIVRQAYDQVFDPSASCPGTRSESSRDMPKFSRTTLQ